MLHVLTSKKAWALAALTATALAVTTSAVSAAPAPRTPAPRAPVAKATAPRATASQATAPQASVVKAPVQVLHLNFSGDPESFGGVGTVTAGKSTAQVGMVYDLCNKDSESLRTDLIFCSGVIRLLHGAQGTIAFEAAAPRPGLAARYPIHFDGAVTGGTGCFKRLVGQVNFTQTGPSTYNVTFS